MSESRAKMAKSATKPLSGTAELLCQNYAMTRDWGQAAERVGVTHQWARKLSTQLNVRQRVAELLQKQVAKIEVQQHQVIAAAAALAFSDLTETLHCETIEDFKALPGRVRQAIAGVDYEIGLFRDADGNIGSRRYIKRIRMHQKTESIKLLALATNITVPLRDRDIADKPSLTGISYIKAEDVEPERNE